MPDYRSFELCRAEDMELYKTFDCGQCFRWRRDAEGRYFGVAMNRAARLWREGGAIYIECEPEALDVWRRYFDMDTDYNQARESVMLCDYMRECAEFGAGIRILRQEPWEALCSFIISQCNNIPRIMSIVARLCELGGERITAPWGEAYAFPSAERVAVMPQEALASLRAGYRAAYISAAARAVASGKVNFAALAALPEPEARRELKKLPGVGDKVASCVTLFGLHLLDAFPVDTWMKKALKQNFPPDFNPNCFGKYAGLAQQYMFYHARENGIS